MCLIDTRGTGESLILYEKVQKLREEYFLENTNEC